MNIIQGKPLTPVQLHPSYDGFHPPRLTLVLTIVIHTNIPVPWKNDSGEVVRAQRSAWKIDRTDLLFAGKTNSRKHRKLTHPL